ncbi:hypothetical protein [Bacillus smithii]|uniref:hypothetical protein n=1 Tax=Bacillus smithii TaxID=1479 RepID=UPI00065DC720|nr:hypothetical protein [Bacillus smithii]AKP48749.1 hypothetical protein BSM4216_3590 [Bacillus smithii]MED0658609.1 hypothetical protein [Bacillus smithii]MED1488302.1 hypothetical protein [Bacillus smithii]
MNINVWEFMGIQRTDQTESDRLLTFIMNSMISSLFHCMKWSPANFVSFPQMVKYGIELDDENSYFWDWMNEYGIGYVKNIGKTTLPDTEEILNFLTYRQMLLEMDIENEIHSNLLLSISELLTALNEFITGCMESSATDLVDVFEETVFFNNRLKSDSDHIEWEFILSSAVNQQGFCYNYTKKGVDIIG